MDHYPFSGYSAMSWCGYILTKKKESDIKTTTWNHENIHLQQAKDKGSWLKYYADYVWEWIKGNPITYPASSAYYTIPYEMEAYANEDKSDYEINTNKYKIKIVKRPIERIRKIGLTILKIYNYGMRWKERWQKVI